MNNEEVKEILEQLKDSVDYPKIDVPTFDGSDSEYIDNDTLLEPNKCKVLLDCITNFQNELKYQKEMEDEYIEKHTKLLQDYTNLQKENERLKNREKELKYFNDILENKEIELLKENHELKETIEELQKEISNLEMNNLLGGDE